MSAIPLSSRRITAQSAALLLVAALGWLGVIARARSTEAMSSTMALELPAFILLWTLMMAAMMLPSVAPVASLYARSVTSRRWVRLSIFAFGYLVAWGTASIPAFGLTWLVGKLTAGRALNAAMVASGIFALCGVYQLTPLKHRCLRQCRSPFSLLLLYGSYRRTVRDLAAGIHHGVYCLGCCWALMTLLVALGMMNLVVMGGLAAVVLIEKIWARGEVFSRAVGLAALVLAIAVIGFPQLAPGLYSGAMATTAR